MKRIALVATGPLSGKTTLAEYMRDRLHFSIACHICTLVDSFVEFHRFQQYPYHELNSAEVFEYKEKYRTALQDHAIRMGFHDPALVGYWIDRTVASAMSHFDSSTLLSGNYGLVFDPIRGALQAQYLHEQGWTIVQLQISENERKRRAIAMGKDYEQIWDAMQRHPDIEGGVDLADFALHTEGLTTDTIARMVLNFAEEQERSNDHNDATSSPVIDELGVSGE